MNRIFGGISGGLFGATLALLMIASGVWAQTPISASKPVAHADTAMIFQPVEPLLRSQQEIADQTPNTWGFSAAFSDYGFGGGMFLGRSFSPDFTALVTFDIGTAEGPREFDLLEVNKVNRIFVIPVMLTAEYRLFRFGLTNSLRPYLSAGAGPVFAMTTPYNDDFFSGFGSAKEKTVPGGFVGFGANFGSDPSTNFGASFRYFIIPYPGSIESTTTESLTNLSGIYIAASYAMNF